MSVTDDILNIDSLIVNSGQKIRSSCCQLRAAMELRSRRIQLENFENYSESSVESGSISVSYGKGLIINTDHDDSFCSLSSASTTSSRSSIRKSIISDFSSFTFSDVSIGDEIGSGSYGKVYKAMIKATGSQIAVKSIPFNSESDIEIVNEISLLSHLEHPNIVKYFGHEIVQTGESINVSNLGSQSRLMIFYEYMSGGSIASAIRQFGKFSERVVIVYCKQILSGLLFLHKNRVIHRDLKGDNILLDVNGGCKLADFGCSKKMDVTSIGRTRIMKTMKGSIPWMAPEILMGQGYGKEADVWAFGCLVVEMVTGKPPWGHFDNIIQAMFKITMSSDVPEIPINISFTCREFAFACMRRDSKTRPTCIELISHHFLLSDNLNNHSSPPRMTISHHDTSSSIINKTNSSPSPSTHQSLHPSTSTIITTTLTPTTSPSFSPTYSTTSTAISTPISTPITSTLQLFKLRQ